MRVMFTFPHCFLSQITYLVELLLKEKRKVSGFFPNTLFMFSQECLENRHVFKCFYFFELFFCLLCTLAIPAVNPLCLCHVYIPLSGTARSPKTHPCCCLPQRNSSEMAACKGSAGTRRWALPQLWPWEAASGAAQRLPRGGCCSLIHQAFRAGAGR